MSNEGFANFKEWWEWKLLRGDLANLPVGALPVAMDLAEEAFDAGHDAGYKDAYG